MSWTNISMMTLTKHAIELQTMKKLMPWIIIVIIESSLTFRSSAVSSYSQRTDNRHYDDHEKKSQR